MEFLIRHGRLVMMVLFVLPMVCAVQSRAAEPGSPPAAAHPTAPPAAGAFPGADPTGLPPALNDWRDPNWQEPTGTLKVVSYDSVPLNEVANNLRREFKEAFDVVIPRSWEDPRDPSIRIEPGAFEISLRLKNVTATEAFQAINMTLEAENRPARWELKMNGNRPMAVLRVLPHLLPTAGTRPPAEPPRRMVIFVGDLLGEEPKGMKMNQLIDTLTMVYIRSYGNNPPEKFLQYHNDAQILVIHGTVDQVDLVQQTLNAIKQKIALARRPNPPTAAK
jgi:hypothetical protein